MREGVRPRRGPADAQRGRGGARPSRVLVWGAAAAVVVATVAPILVWWLTNPPDQRMVDLEVYRDGGRAVLRGGPLYEVLTQPPQLLPFTYPPFAGLLAVPFTLMPWRVAQFAWMGLIYASLVAVVWFSFRGLIRRAAGWAPLVMAALIGASAWLMPVFDQARFGQVGLVLMALCLADCVPERTPWPRGLLVGLAVAIKLVPGVFLIYFLVTGRREAAGNAVMTAAAATLGAFALLPHDSADYWFGALLEGGERTGAITGTTNQAINGMVARTYIPDPFGTLIWLVLAAVMAWIGFSMVRALTSRSDELTLDGGDGDAAYSLRLAGVAITGLLSVLLSPVGWIHHLVWMVPVLGAVLGDGRDTRRRLIAALGWLYFAFPLPWWGAKLISLEQGLLTKIPGKIVQDAFGLAAVTMVFVLGRWLFTRAGQDSAKPADASPREAEMGTLTV